MSDTTPALGDVFVYSMQATNSGPGNAEGVVVTDDIAAPLHFLVASSICSPAAIGSGQTRVTCAVGDLAAGSSRTITVRVKPVFSCDFVGTSGNDSDAAIGSTNGADVICGGGGSDTFSGRGGDDTLYGLANPATLDALPATLANTGRVTATTLDLAPANNSAAVSVTVRTGRDGRDTISGNDGNDFIDGQGDADTLNGGAGDDMMNGGAGNDTMNGNGGNDTMHGQDGADLMEGAGGNDTIYGEAGRDELHGGTLVGGSRHHIVQWLYCGSGVDRYSLGPPGERQNACERIVGR